MANKSLLSD